MDEREEVVVSCSVHLELSILMLIDEMTNLVDEAYAALPERLYLIDQEGKWHTEATGGLWASIPPSLRRQSRHISLSALFGEALSQSPANRYEQRRAPLDLGPASLNAPGSFGFRLAQSLSARPQRSLGTPLPVCPANALPLSLAVRPR